MKLGVCYYPEHWPEARWAEDAALMKAAGLTYVRIAEFAWTALEPAEGQFTWEWLDRAIATLSGAGLQVVLGTPTPTPPAWLVRTHPDILPVDRDGKVREFGSRRHYCANNQVYRQHTARFVEAMARRYGANPAVTGWQIDNELGCHDTARCYCPRCAAAFRFWLQKRYGSLPALNQAWGAVFWSQSYSDWSQIKPPNLTVTEANPSHVLDYYRFSSEAVTAYQQLQVDLLRKHTTDQFITHNLMGEFFDLDYHALGRTLDFVTWDSYPTGYLERAAERFYQPGEERPALAYDLGDPYVTGFCHDLMRGIKQAPFWIMEQQAGNINWGVYNTGIRPGGVRLWTWHALASGADVVSFFRWRACLYAQEQYHSGLLHHDASPDLGYREAQAMLGEREVMERVSGQPHQAQVALLFDYQDLWALQLQPHRQDFTYLRALFVYYRALVKLGLAVDVVSPRADLARYRLVIAPTLHLVDQALVDHLDSFVQGGGVALLGVRSGFKTPSNLVTDQPLPGLLRPLVGATVSDWHALPPGEGLTFESNIQGLIGEAGTWVEALVPDEAPEGAAPAEVVVRYTEEPFAGKAALTIHGRGAGRVGYVGWLPTVKQAQAMLLRLIPWLGLDAIPDLPEGVIAVRRGSTLVLMNFAKTGLSVRLKNERLSLKARDVLVVDLPAS